MRGKIKVGIALGLAALATSVALPATASTTSPAQAATKAPPIVVRGTLTVAGAAGTQTSSRALGGDRVALYAMPAQPYMNKLQPGDRVQGKLVGVTTSSTSGAYAIRLTHPAALRSSAYRGLVNLEVWAAGHGYWTVYGFSRQAAGASSPLRATLTMHPLSTPAAAAPASSGCWVLAPNGDLGPVWTKLEGLWSTISGVKKYLSYTVGSSSSVSIAVEVNYKWVSGQDGNNTVTSTTGGEDYPMLRGTKSRVGKTEMEEGLFNSCEISGQDATFPYAVDGGTGWIKSKPPKARYCVPQLAGSDIHMEKTQSFTFADGINLEATFGISLSATTGYSKEAAIKYTYTANGYACGTHSYPLRPGDTAHGVVADHTVHGNA